MQDLLTIKPAFMVDDASVLAETDLTRCILLMTIGRFQFGYAVLDPLHRRFILLKSYYYEQKDGQQATLDMLERCLDLDKVLYTAFHEVRIGFDFPCHTLVPAAHYQPELRREYLAFLYGMEADQTILCDSIKEYDCKNVFEIHKNIAGYLRKEFAAAKIFHTETACLKSLSAQHGLTDDSLLCLRILPHRMTITGLLKKQLQYHQTFPFRHEQDVAYRLLNVLEQLEWEPLSAEVKLCGEVNETSRIFQELNQVIPRLGWMPAYTEFGYVEAFKQYPGHHFRSILSLATCE